MGEAVNFKYYLPFDSMGDMLDYYQQSLEAGNRSSKTISWYREILERFFNFLGSSGQLKPLSQLGKKELEAYILYLHQATKWPNMKYGKASLSHHLSPFTIQGHVRAIKAFWGWLYGEGFISENPLAKSPLPKVPKNIVKTLSKEDISKLLNEVDRQTPLGFKYYCVLLILLDTGLRVSELAGIKMGDISISEGLIKITGKGQKERMVPFCKTTRKVITKYTSQFRQSLCPQESPYLFAKRDGDNVTIGSIQQYIRRLAGKAGLQGIKCSPHIFRHTFATQAVANEAHPFVLKEIMGHESLQTTLKYTNLTASEIKKQHSKFSPVAGLIKGK